MAFDKKLTMVSLKPTTASVVLSIILNSPFNLVDFWLTSPTSLSILDNVLMALITRMIKATTNTINNM